MFQLWGWPGARDFKHDRLDTHLPGYRAHRRPFRGYSSRRRMASTLKPYLNCVRSTLDAALCLRNFPSQVCACVRCPKAWHLSWAWVSVRAAPSSSPCCARGPFQCRPVDTRDSWVACVGRERGVGGLWVRLMSCECGHMVRNPNHRVCGRAGLTACACVRVSPGRCCSWWSATTR